MFKKFIKNLIKELKIMYYIDHPYKPSLHPRKKVQIKRRIK